MSNRKPMQVTKRIVNTKRHVVAYVVNGKRMGVRQVSQLADRGIISGVRRVGNHIQSAKGRRNLSSLSTIVE